jgi:hypothetical protein
MVERNGPEMLEMLHTHTLGDNRTRFGHLAYMMITNSGRPRASAQLQLI